MLPRHLESARAVALASSGVSRGKFKVGAVLVHRRHGIIAARHNSYKTHPALSKFTPYPHLHAESAVILAAGTDAAEGCDIYVTRILKCGAMAMAKPCEEMCQRLMAEACIRRCYYTVAGGGVEVMEFN